MSDDRLIEYLKTLPPDAPERVFLQLLALSERPMEAAALQALLRKAELARPLAPSVTRFWHRLGLGKPEPAVDWPALLSRLHEAGLLPAAPDSHGPFHTHAHIREHFAHRLRESRPELWQQAHAVLFRHFQQQPHTPSDPEALHAAVHHGWLAGEYQKAYQVYQDRIEQAHDGSDADGLFARALRTLAVFFPHGWHGEAPAQLSPARQGRLAGQAAFYLIAHGRLEEALGLRRMHLRLAEQQQDWIDAAIAANNLSDLLLLLGRLDEARAVATQGLAWADQHTDDWCRQMINRTKLAAVLHRQGDLQQAHARFAEAEALQRQYQPQHLHLYSVRGARFCALLLDMAEDEAARAAVLERVGHMQHATRKSGFGLLSIAYDHLCHGRALAALGQTGAARDALDAAVAGIRQAGRMDLLPEFLLIRAVFWHAQGELGTAWQDWREAMEIIETARMRLHEADAHLLAAELAAAGGDAEAARTARDRAAGLIEETGYGLRGAKP